MGLSDAAAMTLEPRDDDIVWREVGDEIVILQFSSSQYLTLNGSGRALWLRLVKGATADDLADELVERYGIDHARSEVDVASFIGDLRDLNVIA